MKTCPNCNAENEAFAPFCDQCGERLIAIAPPQSKTERFGVRFLGVVCGIVIALLYTFTEAMSVGFMAPTMSCASAWIGIGITITAVGALFFGIWRARKNGLSDFFVPMSTIALIFMALPVFGCSTGEITALIGGKCR